MAQCNFSIPFTSSPEALAGKAQQAIMGAGGSFQGDSAAGNFAVSTPLGDIRGSYVIQASTIMVTISSKPFLVSCGMIEKQLRGYFEAMT
ncbi:MAG TPA: hypothetical protein VGD40_07645 [Chryseosolibacter sp.]